MRVIIAATLVLFSPDWRPAGYAQIITTGSSPSLPSALP
jgi:hypothetical protein